MGIPLAKLDYRDLYQIKWILGGLLSVLAMWNVFALDLGFTWLVWGAASLMAGALLYPPLTNGLPAWFWKMQTPLIVVFVVSDFILAGGDYIPPLIRMILLLTLLRTLQPRTRREDLQLLLLALILLIVSGVLTLEISFALQVVLFTPLAMLYLFVISLAEAFGVEPEVPEEPWNGFSWRAFSQRVRGLFDARLIAFGGMLFVFLTVLSAGIFISLPRFELGQALPFLRMQATASSTGFSEDIRFGDVVSILNNNAVAFRADVPERSTSPIYWRMMALDEYTGEGFVMSEVARSVGRRMSAHTLSAPSALRRHETSPEDGDWTLYLEGGVSRFLPIPGLFDTLRFQNRQDLTVFDGMGAVSLRELPANVSFFQLTRVREVAALPRTESDRALLRSEGERGSGALAAYAELLLGLPDDPRNRRILEEAVEKIAGGETLSVQDFGQRAIAYLQHNRGYSLETRIPPGREDPVLRWMQAGLDGHCELYAAALVLLARAAGHPARVIVGFAGGDWNGFENYYMVRHLHAHAWTEIFDQDLGWLHFEPTPAADGPGGSSPGSDAADTSRDLGDRTWAAYLDSLRVIWFRRVVNFDRAQQAELIQGVRQSVGSIGEGVRETLRDALAAIRSAFENPLTWRDAGWILRNLAIAAFVWVALRFLYGWLRGRQFAWPGGARRTRAEAGRWLRRLREAPGSCLPPGVESPEIPEDTVEEALYQLRYGPPPSWPAPAETFQRARQTLRERRRAAR
ncbi:MAG: DUF3488 domain-containing protein [Opitutales bacterium]|nr:DUF3488 domain-containing protein [Opitutales bacterium]